MKKELTLSYTSNENWWKRSIPINSNEWKQLRLKILNRDGWKCNFCKIKLYKYMVVDHINGSALDNQSKNLRLNCPACDRIRHCGLSTIKNLLTAGFSSLTQLEIIKKTHEFYRKNKRVPHPREIDINFRAVQITPIEVAEMRSKNSKSDLTLSLVNIRGFFTKFMDFNYLNFEERVQDSKKLKLKNQNEKTTEK